MEDEDPMAAASVIPQTENGDGQPELPLQ